MLLATGLGDTFCKNKKEVSMMPLIDSSLILRLQEEAFEKIEVRERLITNLVFERLAKIQIGRHDLLSPRELETFCAVIRGESARAMAQRVGLAGHTVSLYQDKAAIKLGVEHGRNDLLAYAFKIAMERK